MLTTEDLIEARCLGQSKASLSVDLVKRSTEVDCPSLVLDLVKEASDHFRHRVQLDKEFKSMLLPSSYLSSRKDVVGPKRQGMKFQKMATLKKQQILSK